MPKRRRNSENQSGQGSPVPLDFNAAPRAAQALRLRRLGYHYDQIAQQCGYRDESGARKAVKTANARIIRDESTALVNFHCDMIEQALQVVMRRIDVDGPDSLWAVDRLVPLLKRYSELLNLDKPKDEAPMAGKVVIRAYPSEWVNALPALGAPTDPLASLPVTSAEEVKP